MITALTSPERYAEGTEPTMESQSRPTDPRLNSRLEIRRADIQSELARVMIQHKDILDPEREFETVWQLNMLTVTSRSTLEHVLHSSDEETQRGLYRGFQFGKQVAHMLYDEMTDVPLVGYLKQSVKTGKGLETIVGDIEECKARNPELVGFFDRYIVPLDQGRNRRFETRLASTVMLMLAEQQQVKLYHSMHTSLDLSELRDE